MTYILHIEPEQMALKAAYDCNQTLFEAIVRAAAVDVQKIASFTSHADHDMDQTFFLIYEVARKGDANFLRELIENYGLSPYCVEELRSEIAHQRNLHAEREAAAEARGETVRVTATEMYYFMLEKNPYNVDSLIDFVRLERTKCVDKIIENRSARRKNTVTLRQHEAAVAGRSINSEKYETYISERSFVATGALSRAILGGSINKVKMRPRVPLYDHEQSRRACQERADRLKEEYDALKIHQAGLEACIAYADTFPPYAAAAA